MIVGPMIPRPRTFAKGGAWASAISCQKITCSIRLAPRPPYSLGHEIPAQPPSYSLRCQRFRYSKRDSIDSSRRSSQSLGALAASQLRNSSRNLISSGLRFRSMVPPEWSTGALAWAWNEMNGHSFRRQVYIVILILVAALQTAKDYSSTPIGTAPDA